MYVCCNTGARSRNHFCHEHAMCSLCISDIHTYIHEGVAMEANNAFSVPLHYICRCQPYKTHLSRNIKGRYFCTILSKIWDFSTDFRRNSQYKISRKSIHWDPRWYTRIDGRTNMTKLTDILRVLREHAWKYWYQIDNFVTLLYRKQRKRI